MIAARQRGPRSLPLSVLHSTLSPMTIFEIHDMRADRYVLAVDLRHVLAALNERAASSEWEAGAVTADDENLWAVGDDGAVRELEALAASGERLSGATLTALANRIDQVIWGEFRAFDRAASSPWVVVRAIDSTFYEIESDDPFVAEAIRSAFNDVRVRD